VISVVIPAWNAEATLGETLASVAAQTRPADEVIVVDDGSADATAAIARAAGVRVVSQANAGGAAATNAGTAASGGDLIAFLDSDDVWTPDKLALQMAALAADPVLDGVFGHVRFFRAPSLTPDADRPGWLSGAMLIRRSSLDAVGDFDPTMAAGYFVDWMDRAQRGGLRFAMLPQTVLLRRIRPGSLSTQSAHRDAGYVRMARAAILRRRMAETG
jgi:glycosyltransferase involved in cell wall biosynthesis